MPVTIFFLTFLAVIAGWWLLQQRLHAKPWLEEGVIGEFDGTGAMDMPAAKIGLGLFLAVVGTLFALLISAYFMRMGYADWQNIRVPQILWLNTGALAASSIALQTAQSAVYRRHIDGVRSRLIVAGAFGVLFLAGQFWAWHELTDSGFLLASNPSNSFFYLITGLHGLHVIGGMAALGWVTDRAWRSQTAEPLRLPVEMCTLYWHFLLFVWIVLFSLLTGWADEFGAICRQLLT
ncbi:MULTISPECIES: cytochrome c oxidase subunit 3 [Rhodomicrobium]|uniref:cytochrome c oxidase subunit 3 n=1 Tax=Rhodomicrobium TaxID=1068 RepID=UPI000B4B5C9B|nr:MULTISPECIES: cytochrome c oxidase subunit 3 [Rhodomicrobium]